MTMMTTDWNDDSDDGNDDIDEENDNECLQD